MKRKMKPRENQMDDIDALRDEAKRVQERISRIEVAARRAENESLIGKTFRYRNCYSCPQKPSDYWYNWMVVQRVDKYGCLVCFEFYIDSYGKFHIEPKRCLYILTDGYRPVTLAQFKAAWRSFCSRVAAFEP